MGDRVGRGDPLRAGQPCLDIAQVPLGHGQRVQIIEMVAIVPQACDLGFHGRLSLLQLRQATGGDQVRMIRNRQIVQPLRGAAVFLLGESLVHGAPYRISRSSGS